MIISLHGITVLTIYMAHSTFCREFLISMKSRTTADFIKSDGLINIILDKHYALSTLHIYKIINLKQ